MAKVFEYPCKVVKVGQWYEASFKDLESVGSSVTCAETYEGALVAAKELLTLLIADRIGKGLTIPSMSEAGEGEVMVESFAII